MRIRKAILIISAIMFIVGCASSPKLINMIPNDDELVFDSTGKSLKIGTSVGGEETNPMGSSKINSRDFRLALIESLKKSNLFSEILSSGETDYEL